MAERKRYTMPEKAERIVDEGALYSGDFPLEVLSVDGYIEDELDQASVVMVGGHADNVSPLNGWDRA